MIFRVLILSIICSSTALVAEGQSYLVETTKLNLSSANEFAPAYYDGKLVFTSDRKNSMFTDHVSNDSSRLKNLYIASDHNSPGKLFDKSLSVKHDNMTGAFSPSGDTLVFARALPGGTKEKPANFGLFMSTKLESGWSDPQALSMNNETYTVCQPSFSPDGGRLYFASNMRNKGNSEILYVEIANGTFGEPVSLSDKVNTRNPAYFPYAAKNGIVYFSSKRPDGVGNYDIYAYSLTDDMVYPLPEPINSEYNDFGFITKDMQSGYFSSNRGGDNYDIFYFVFDSSKYENCVESEQTELCYSFAEADAESNENSAIKYFWNMGDGTVLEGSAIDHCYKDTGQFVISLSLLDTLTNLEYPDVAVYMFEIDLVTTPFIDCPDTLVAGESFEIAAGNYDAPSGSTPGYKWEFGDNMDLKKRSGSHIYAKGGNYRINLIIEEKNGSSDSLNTICVYKDVLVIDERDMGSVTPRGGSQIDKYKLLMKGRTAFEPNGMFFAKQSAAIIMTPK